MANGKNPYLRYKIIDACLSNRHTPYCSISELIAAIEKQDIKVSKRSVETDLQSMRRDERLGYMAPISYCRINHGYYYTDADYTINNLPFNEEDVAAFAMVVESFQRFRGAQVLNQVEGMFDKLNKVARQLKMKSTKQPYTPVLFEHVPYCKGIEHFDLLYKAILKQTPLLIRYKRFDHEIAREHTLHPYLLKEYRFRWCLLGYSETRKYKLIMALDRIERMVPVKTPFKPYKGDEVQKYFDHTIGVTIASSAIKEIRLWCSVAQANYIRTQPLHATQQVISDDAEGMIITLHLIPNYELKQTLLALGPEVKVLEPASLRDEVKTMLEKSLLLYNQ